MLPLLFWGEFDLPLRHRPGMVAVFRVKHAAAPEPVLIAMIVHLIAKPCGRKHLCFFSCSLRLRLLRFLDAGADEIGSAQDGVRVQLHLVREFFAKFRISVGRPYDILFCRFILKQHIQHLHDRVAADIN